MVKLKPTLGLFDAVSINIGAIIGAGIFVVTGIVAGLAGPALVVSMLVSSAAALVTALSFIELTRWLPSEGSAYVFASRLINPTVGFTAGWMWVLYNVFAGTAVSLSFAHYLRAIIPASPIKPVAALLCIAFTALNYRGVQRSAELNDLLVFSKLVVLGFFVLFGLIYVKPSNFAPFVPSGAGVLYGAYYIFFAFGGFSRVTVVSEEVKDAERVVPRAILISLAVSTAFYLSVGIVAVGLVGAPVLAGSNSPLADAIRATGSGTAVYLVSFGGMLSTASVLLTSILGVSRMSFSMARRGDLPEALSRLHERYDTPYYSVLIAGAIVTLLVLFVDLTSVVAIGTFAMLFYYGVANVSASMLRGEDRAYPRLVPFVGVSTCGALLVFALLISPETWVAGVAGFTVGLFFLILERYRKRH